MSYEKIAEAKQKMQQLIDAQDKVDKGIAQMPEGADKQRLIKLRDENRGFFSNYILPAWRKLQGLISEDTSPPKPGSSVWYNPTTWFSGVGGDTHAMGVLPLIPVAAVVAATALLGYVANNIVVENRILSDPSFTASQKAKLLESGGISAITGALGQTKWLMIIGLLGAGAFLFKDEIKSRLKK